MNIFNDKIKRALLAAKHDDSRLSKELNISVNLPKVGEVYLSTIFRVIKGKRIACLGKTSTQKVFVKIYFDSLKAGIHYRRSLRGTLAFLNNSILTPELIFSGFCPEYNFYVIIQEFIADAKTMGQILWDTEKISERHDLIDAFMACLAVHHKQGIIQNDLQMGNFLIRKDKIFSIDGDQVVEKKRPINKIEAIENLAAYFYNLPIDILDHLPRFFRNYCQSRNWNSSDSDIKSLTNKINKRKKLRIKRFLKKIFKSKDPFEVKKSRHHFSVRYLKTWHHKYSDIIENPFRFIPEAGNKFCPVGSFDCEIGSTVLQVNFGKINSLMRIFKKDHFSKQWRRSFQQNLQGDSAKIPIALINIKKQGKWFGFIVSEKSSVS
jgi:tRNA A-37 threonylcarbamoyl transferase component Bud32